MKMHEITFHDRLKNQVEMKISHEIYPPFMKNIEKKTQKI